MIGLRKLSLSSCLSTCKKQAFITIFGTSNLSSFGGKRHLSRVNSTLLTPHNDDTSHLPFTTEYDAFFPNEDEFFDEHLLSSLPPNFKRDGEGNLMVKVDSDHVEYHRDTQQQQQQHTKQKQKKPGFSKALALEKKQLLSSEDSIEDHENSLYQKQGLIAHANSIQDSKLKDFYLGMDKHARSMLTLSELKGHIYAFAMDKFGSAFISNSLQRRKVWIAKGSDKAREITKKDPSSASKLEQSENGLWFVEHEYALTGTPASQEVASVLKKHVIGHTTEDVDMVFEEVLPHLEELNSHVYGKFIVYHLLMVCSPKQSKIIFDKSLKGSIKDLVFTAGGSMICERIYELFTNENDPRADMILSELKGSLSKCIRDAFAQYIIDAIARGSNMEHRKQLLNELIETDSIQELLALNQPCRVLEKFVKFSETRTILLGKLSKIDYVNLSKDTHGACFITQTLKYASSSQKRLIIDAFKGHLLISSLGPSASHVVNQLFIAAKPEEIDSFLVECKGHFLAMSQDRYATFFMKQILCSTYNVKYLDLVVQELRGSLVLLSYQRYSSKVIEYVLNMIVHYSKKGVALPFSLDELLNEFSKHTVQLSKDKYGAFCIQQVLNIAFAASTCNLVSKETKISLMKDIWQQAMQLALDKHGCFIIQFLVRTPETRMPMMRRFLETEDSPKEFNSNNFFMLINSEQGTSVLMELVKQSDTNQRNALFTVMKSYRSRIKESYHGRQLLKFSTPFDELGVLSSMTDNNDMNIFPSSLSNWK